MSPKEFCEKYPCLYHMAESNSWESIQRHGLLSTSALLDLFEVPGEMRVQLESQHRPDSIPIYHDKHGSAVIRDQKPMSDSALGKCLLDMTPAQWYETLNRKVFFWLTRKRVLGLLSARAYRSKRHTVLTIDTDQMLRRHSQNITLSPINSGCTLFRPVSRGSSTFARFSDYPFHLRESHADLCVELAVEHSVRDISEFTIRVEEMQEERVIHLLYERSPHKKARTGK